MVIALSDRLELSLSQPVKIGEGRYREVFRLGDQAFKILKPCVRKEYSFFHVDFPAELYTKYKFGIPDFNQFEYEVYKDFIKSIPEDFKGMFVHIHKVGRYGNRSFSLSDLVVDGNCEVSKSLLEHKPVEDQKFWERLDCMEEVLASRNVPILDIRGENIVVKEERGELFPVMIDYKRYGNKSYPMQVWLLSEQRLIGKMRRRFRRLREVYKPD